MSSPVPPSRRRRRRCRRVDDNLVALGGLLSSVASSSAHLRGEFFDLGHTALSSLGNGQALQLQPASRGFDVGRTSSETVISASLRLIIFASVTGAAERGAAFLAHQIANAGVDRLVQRVGRQRRACSCGSGSAAHCRADAGMRTVGAMLSLRHRRVRRYPWRCVTRYSRFRPSFSVSTVFIALAYPCSNSYPNPASEAKFPIPACCSRGGRGEGTRTPHLAILVPKPARLPIPHARSKLRPVPDRRGVRARPWGRAGYSRRRPRAMAQSPRSAGGTCLTPRPEHARARSLVNAKERHYDTPPTPFQTVRSNPVAARAAGAADSAEDPAGSRKKSPAARWRRYRPARPLPGRGAAAAGMTCRHCERSEAIQNRRKPLWVLCSLCELAC